MAIDQNEVAIFWDFGSCPAPHNSTGYEIVRNIRSLALRFGDIKSFKAYLSVSAHMSMVPDSGSPLLRSQLQSSGVSLTDVPGGKDVADKMLLVDMLTYAFDRPSTSTVVLLISADPSLAYALSVLRLRNHHVVVVSPPETKLDLVTQASLFFDWEIEVVRGLEPQPSVPLTERRRSPSKRGGDTDHKQDRGSQSSPSPSPSPLPPKPTRPKVPVSTSEVVLEDYISIANIASIPSKAPSNPAVVRLEFPSRNSIQLQDTAMSPASKSSDVPSVSADGDNQSNATNSDAAATNFSPAKTPTSTIDQKAATTLEGPSFIATETHLLEKPPNYSSRSPSVSPCKDSSSKPNVRATFFNDREKNIPSGFEYLVELLRLHRAAGTIRPLRSVIGYELLQKDPKIYQKVGLTRFFQYAAMAEDLEVAKLGGAQGTAWMSLHPTL